ncbi:MAG: hypothetical protein ACRCZ0_12370 [Cetobacterium sp.]
MAIIKALPTGTISMSDVNAELKRSGTISLNDGDVRKLAGKPSGIISMSDLRGKSNANKIKVGTYRSSYNNQIMYWGYIEGTIGDLQIKQLDFLSLYIKELYVEVGFGEVPSSMYIQFNKSIPFNVECKITFGGKWTSARPFNQAVANEGFVQFASSSYGDIASVMNEFKRVSLINDYFDIKVEIYYY